MVFLEGPPRTPLRRPTVPKITQEEHRVAPKPIGGAPVRIVSVSMGAIRSLGEAGRSWGKPERAGGSWEEL